MWNFFALFLVIGVSKGHVFRLGYITGSKRRPWDFEYPRPGLSISGAISLAVDVVNTQQIIPDGGKLEFVIAETFGEEEESLRLTAQFWKDNISAIIGPQETCVHEAKLASSFHLPMVSYYCTNYETSDKRLFPTFARTRPPDTQISKSVASVLLKFNWKKVALFYRDSSDSQFGKIAARIISTLENSEIEVKFTSTWGSAYHHGWQDNPFEQMVEDTFKDIRIYVILGQYYEHVGLMVAMEQKGLFETGDYFVVGVDIERYDPENPIKYMHGILKDEPEPQVVGAYRNYIGIMASPSVDFQNFTVLVNQYMEKPPFSIPNPLAFFGGLKKIKVEAAYLYDAVLLYATAVREAILENMNPYNGSEVSLRMRNRTYISAMGYSVYMDENGDAEGNYTLIARASHHSRPEEWGIYPVGVFQHMASHLLPELEIIGDIEWLADSSPLDEPPCGFRGERCVSYTVEITGGIVGSLLVITLIISVIVYRNWKYEQELDSLLWKINFREVQQIDSGFGNSGFAVGKFSKGSQMSLLSTGENEQRLSNIVFAPIVHYRGRICAVKKVCRKDENITREIKKELKMMRDLHHDNLASFIGAWIEAPHFCILTEYCSRGSLKDILENENFRLDAMFIASLVEDLLRSLNGFAPDVFSNFFRFHFITDMLRGMLETWLVSQEVRFILAMWQGIQGMTFLHDSPVHSHGNLKTANCLVDARWVLKIADFGLNELKQSNDGYENILEDIEKRYLDCLYKAPELLRDLASPPSGSQEGDSYSFGMILYQIHTRKELFAEFGMTSIEVVSRIKSRELNSPAFRPALDRLTNVPECVLSTVRDCWNEDPDLRPDFKAIRTKLRPLRKGMKANIFDNMLGMMEKYANNLEVLVDERTELLIEEKRKTDALLYEMLPRFVADQLKRGSKVEAESYDSVTIYFSDIVGFTDMSAQSTALQVVDFLNDLYTCFDSIIGNYDVYKVETIGDAYMVVSGLPVRNGEQHAGEIASMSLHLLSHVRQFRIRHRQTDTLMLRIGIHTGPVCAGVVGVKMPRYCLFGDTVNTASRMESTGIPLKIHCSAECKELLDRLGGYHFEQRGLVKMKGKGEKLTYWLSGQDVERYDKAPPMKPAIKNFTELFDSRSSFRRGKDQNDQRPLLTPEDAITPTDKARGKCIVFSPSTVRFGKTTSMPSSETVVDEQCEKKNLFRWRSDKCKVVVGNEDSPLLRSNTLVPPENPKV